MGYRDWREMEAEKIGGPADAPKINVVTLSDVTNKLNELLDAIRTSDFPEEYTTHHAASSQYKYGYRDGMMQVVERVDNLLYELKLKKARR